MVFFLSDRLRQVYFTHIYQNLYMFNATSLHNKVLYRLDKYIYEKIKASLKTFTRQVYFTHIYQNLYMFNATSLHNKVLYRLDKYIYEKIKASLKTFTRLYRYILVYILCNVTDRTSQNVTAMCILVVTMLTRNGFLM